MTQITEYNDSPYKVIPFELTNEYTMNGKIPLEKEYVDDRKMHGVKWTNEMVSKYIETFLPSKIKYQINGTEGPYGIEACLNLLQAFEDYKVFKKNVAVVGSEQPWIEAILINYEIR